MLFSIRRGGEAELRSWFYPNKMTPSTKSLSLSSVLPSFWYFASHFISPTFLSCTFSKGYLCISFGKMSPLLKLLMHCFCLTPTPLSVRIQQIFAELSNYDSHKILTANYDEFLWTRNLSLHFYHSAHFLKYTRDP